ncbi:pilus assembly protein [Rhizobium rhizogenes]|uniref:Pilus assembly protein n=2 Tax=Rhizobiaceae TaxID=82115 RepID=A0A546XQU1_RHIRH|nr:pilus assembly protein [Rhizobium rhizogenes]
MFHIEKILSASAHHFRLLLQDRRGNFAIMTALLMPVFLFTFGLLFEGGRALAYYSQSKRVIAQACERSTKPTRTNVPLDEVRRKNVLDTFDALITSTKQEVVSRDVTIDWLTTDIDAKFTYKTVLGGLFNVEKMDYALTYRCDGIPPYPYDGEVIVNNTFDRLNGKDRILENGKGPNAMNGCWGVLSYEELGWDGGTGPGIELQDWSNAACRKKFGWQGYDEPKKDAGPACVSVSQQDVASTDVKDPKNNNKLKESEKDASQSAATNPCPPESDELQKPSILTAANGGIPPTKYVVELDSHWEGQKRRDANSSIFKIVELHPGKYEVSVWYNGRNDAYGGTNDIDIFLQLQRPQLGPEKKIIEMAQKGKVFWERRTYSITVDTYSVYKLTIAAGGKSDSLGGIITAFEVKYVDSPK